MFWCFFQHKARVFRLVGELKVEQAAFPWLTLDLQSPTEFFDPAQADIESKTCPCVFVAGVARLRKLTKEFSLELL